jgi:hypothetical protein
MTYGRSGVILGEGKVPPCPGTPWRTYTYGDKSVSWVLPKEASAIWFPEKIITTGAMAEHGRAYIEASLAEQGLPPLPDEAWGPPLKKKRHRWQYENSVKPPLRRHCVECLAKGRKTGYQGAWFTLLPGALEETGDVTQCPGTPWVRRDSRYGPAWTLHDGERFTYSVTARLVEQFGRERTEEILARYGAPPLPERAWEEMT